MTKVALDAGHGLNTPGKQTPDGIKEWTLNDIIRDKVIEILKPYRVSIINTDDNEGCIDESLNNRLSKYINSGVDVFVSIHHNAFTGEWNGATGVEVYVDRQCTAEDIKLATLIYNRMVTYTGLNGRGIKRANYKVINQNSIPAVLCEGGFMDGTNDYKLITSESGQNAYAKAIAEGIIEFLGLTRNTDSSFKVKVSIPNLNIRKGPGVDYARTGNTTGVGTFTITEVKTGIGSSSGWGKLASKAGWISLDYTTRV